MEEGGEERSGEKGKDNTETKKEEEKKGGGEKGGMAPGRRGNEAENTHKGNGKPKDRDRKDGKEQQEEREFGTKDTQGKYRACVRRRTQKRDKREGAKAVKKEEVPRQERRIQLDRRRTQGKVWKTHRSNGTNWNRKMEGAARIAKRRRHWNRGHTQGKHGRRTRSHT